MNRRSIILFFALCVGAYVSSALAQPKFSQPHGIYKSRNLTVAITSDDADAIITYTTDGSEPTPNSTRYSRPLTINNTTILRAAEVKGDTLSSPISTASYIFISSVIKQPDWPEGYPREWGAYTQISGTAKGDYGMDEEMTAVPYIKNKISEGIESLPILSIVSDKDNFFSHENDPDRGGIYIYTGPPVGDNTGYKWTRAANIELIGGPQRHDLNVGCGVRLHGGHGRLAEKNPKHSFRLVFKQEYGPSTLNYPIFGENEPDKFDQLVLRCHFGNSWQHWADDNRTKAQYTRDVWARLMQKKMGSTNVNALYVNLFLNGMYWGIYNIAERVDDQFGKSRLGGKKSDIDVIKIEEMGGNHLEASEGDLTAWNQMVEIVSKSKDNRYYQQLDTLLNIDSFIDYMLLNQYAGNTDWAHHNWLAIRRRGADSDGFHFLCWDSEVIFINEKENVLTKNDGKNSPTGIFQSLLKNQDFSERYLQRAYELLSDDGLLGPASVTELWDSLYTTLSSALYAEAARWGDYRRDVHRWQTAGKLYTVDEHYMAERQRLQTKYFPSRSKRVLNQIYEFLGADPSGIAEIRPNHSDDRYYNLNGQAVSNPTRGIYIYKGKKYIVTKQ